MKDVISSKSIIKYESEIISDIKDKKELHALDEDFIKNKLEVFFSGKYHEQSKAAILKKIESSKNYKQFTKSREYKFLIKELRAELRKVYGVFILEGYAKRTKLLDELKSAKANNDEEQIRAIHDKLYLLHKSTKERMDHYSQLYDTIFDTITAFDELNEKQITKHTKFVFMDLACGMNPLSTILFKDKIKKYYASDISTEDCVFLKDYFDTTKIDAILFSADLTDSNVFLKLEKIPVDICFIFKTLDGLERIHRNISEDLMKSINTKYFAITFPTLSIGGVREIKEHRRLWFEKMLQKLDWKFEKFLLESELLYVIKKG